LPTSIGDSPSGINTLHSHHQPSSLLYRTFSAGLYG
jgi:hypothetical protein